MDIHYNAFISYRHHPEDIRVATEIHRALERYRIPKAIRKNVSGPLRLFRDKDELPITSNLTDDITRALENSDFLIVICSTHTKESIWVQREIETFLRTHTHDKVLTVLVDGEPYDTIPPILQYKEEADPDTGEMERILIEPLSCDWRVGRKAAYREELPRLAAALLHCGYDELRQRQRQYKMRRLITFFSIALAASISLMAYFLYTSIQIQRANDELFAANQEISRANKEIQEANVQIQDNLDAAMRNQSEYLISAANERYQAGDRMTAISLAMAALPSETSPRPYVPGAERMLSIALGVYDMGRGIVAAGTMECGALVEDFAVTQDGSLVYALDKVNRLSIWNTGSYQKLATLELSSGIYEKMRTLGENVLILQTVVSSGEQIALQCISPEGSRLWAVEACDDFALLGEDTLLTMRASVNTGETILTFLDPGTGRPRRAELRIPMVDEMHCRKFYQESFSPEGYITLEVGSWDEDAVCVVDLQADRVELIRPYGLWEEDQWDYLNIRCGSVTEQGDVVVMISDQSGFYNGTFFGMNTTSPANATLLCYGRDSLKLCWRQMLTSYSYNSLNTVASIPGTGQILCQKDNLFAILDAATGQILSQCETMANVCVVQVGQEKASGILDNGHYYNYIYQDNQCNTIQIVDGNIYKAQLANGYFTLTKNSSSITAYFRAPESQWRTYTGQPSAYLRYSYQWENRLILVGSSTVDVLELGTGELLWSGSNTSGFSGGVLGLSNDATEIYIPSNRKVVAFALSSGRMREVEMPTQVNDGVGITVGSFCYYGDNLYYLISGGGLYFVQLDLVTGKMDAKLFQTGDWSQRDDFGTQSTPVLASDQYVWIWDAGRLMEYSHTEGSFRPVVEALTALPVCQYHPEQDVLTVCAGNALLLRRPGGEELGRLDLGEHKPVNACFYGTDILVLSDAGELLRYDRTGKLLNRAELTVYDSFANSCIPDGRNPLDVKWSFAEDRTLLLGTFGVLNIIDCQQWGTRGYVSEYRDFDRENDRILCYKDSKLGYYPLLTSGQVLEIANKQLNGYRLSQEMKAYYGID